MGGYPLTCGASRLKRLHEVVENGVINAANPSLKKRSAEPSAIRNQAHADAERTPSALGRVGPANSPEPSPTCVRLTAPLRGAVRHVKMAAIFV